MPEADRGMKAHARRLAHSGDWIFAATRLGRDGMAIEIVRHRTDGTRVTTPSVAAPRMTYVHDFAATEQCAVFLLHAVAFAPLKFIVGLSSFAEALTWKPSLGNLLLTVDLATGATRCFEAPPSWCWHIANCFEHNDALVMDFVGYGDAGHFLGPRAQLAAIMQGRDGEFGQPGMLRRYVANRASGTLEETVLCPEAAEFCSTDPRTVGGPHARIFMAVGDPRAGGLVHSGVAAFDPKTARLDRFDFGATTHAGEPVFAPRPGGRDNQGWLIVQLLETERQASAFAIMNAEALADGPQAVVELEQPHPLSFHGQWISP
jgi:all-trans-8'-apo-beta-carotenal 15,15'-oxygenase